MDDDRDHPPDGQLVLAPVSRLTFAERARLINEAYADYFVPLRVTPYQIPRMDEAYDVDLGRSVVAFVGEEPVGMALLGRRGARGWVHSVGTLPRWRRCGIARAMVAQVIARAAEEGVEELSLEVFVQNLPAYRLYESLGFQPRRELLTWQRTDDEDLLPIPREKLVQAQPATLYDLIATWQEETASRNEDERPCWQRDIVSLRRMESALRGYKLPAQGPAAGLTQASLDQPRDAIPDGCCLVSEADHAISIMAVGFRTGADGITVGRTLLQALSARYPGRTLSVLNVPADGFLCRILASLRFIVTTRQLEMVRHFL